LQDTTNKFVIKELGFSCVKKIETVHSFLEKKKWIEFNKGFSILCGC